MNPFDPNGDNERLKLRKGTATARGGHALQRLLDLAETRDSGQALHIARFIAATYKGRRRRPRARSGQGRAA